MGHYYLRPSSMSPPPRCVYSSRLLIWVSFMNNSWDTFFTLANRDVVSPPKACRRQVLERGTTWIMVQKLWHQGICLTLHIFKWLCMPLLGIKCDIGRPHSSFVTIISVRLSPTERSHRTRRTHTRKSFGQGYFLNPKFSWYFLSLLMEFHQ